MPQYCVPMYSSPMNKFPPGTEGSCKHAFFELVVKEELVLSELPANSSPFYPTMGRSYVSFKEHACTLKSTLKSDFP